MSAEVMIPTNLTDLKRSYIKLAKEMDISMIMCGEKEIEIYEKDRDKGYRFAKAIHELNSECKVVDLIGMKMDVDVKGNTLEGSTALYLVDDEYYARLMGEEVGQMSLI